jgi:hypothetical protein
MTACSSINQKSMTPARPEYKCSRVGRTAPGPAVLLSVAWPCADTVMCQRKAYLTALNRQAAGASAAESSRSQLHQPANPNGTCCCQHGPRLPGRPMVGTQQRAVHAEGCQAACRCSSSSGISCKMAHTHCEQGIKPELLLQCPAWHQVSTQPPAAVRCGCCSS